MAQQLFATYGGVVTDKIKFLLEKVLSDMTIQLSLEREWHREKPTREGREEIIRKKAYIYSLQWIIEQINKDTM